MSLLSNLWSALGAIGRFMTGSKAPAGKVEAGIDPALRPVAATSGVTASPTASPTATAVAGFVKRAVVDRFFFASRLKSVARLNTPLGRKPRSTKRPAVYAPAIPAERLGSKKVRIAAGRDLRVLSRIQERNALSAEVIPFPTKRRSAASGEARVAKAA